MMTGRGDDNTLAASVMNAVYARGGDITDADQALVDLALRYADQIDAGIEAGGQDATKALYLGPHLLNALRSLGCAPDARASGGGGGEVAEAPKSRLAEMRAARARNVSGGGA